MAATTSLPLELADQAVASASLEWRLTDRLAFGLTTASDLQRAICRVAEGRALGSLSSSPVVQRALGATPLRLARPRELVVLSGIRTGKSLVAGCIGTHMALTCDLSALGPGEVPRVSIVSLTKDLSEVIFNHIVGRIQHSPLLSRFLAGPPSAESVMLRRPDGRLVEIKVVAGSRAGSSLVARWSAGCIFDEFPRMVGGDDAVVNWDDSREAVLLRLLPGAQLVHIGSPWAPYGPAYDLVQQRFGKPTEDMVVVRAPAYDMNPYYWTEARVEAAKAEADVFRTDVLAEFASPDEALYSAAVVDACTRQGAEQLPPKPGNTYYAAMDPATRGNGWTLVIATREAGRTIVVLAREWRGTRDRPLNPGVVLAEIAGILAAYSLDTVDTDQAMGDAIIALGDLVGLSLVPWRYTSAERTGKALSIRTRLDSNELELPPNHRLRADLLQVRKRVTPGGAVVDLPLTSDGRHCDYFPSLMLVLSRLLPEPVDPKVLTTDPETARLRELMRKRFAQKETW